MPVVSNPRDLDPRFAGFGIRAMGERFAPELSCEKNSEKQGNQVINQQNSHGPHLRQFWMYTTILEVRAGVGRLCCENDGCTPAVSSMLQKSEEAYGLYLPAALPHVGIYICCLDFDVMYVI